MADETDMQGDDTREYGTVEQVAAVYGVSKDTIRRRMKRGEFPDARRETIPSGYRWLLPMPAPGETLQGHEQVLTPVVADLGPVVSMLENQLQARDTEIARLLDLLESQGRALESALERPALPAPQDHPADDVPAAVPPDPQPDTPSDPDDQPTGFWGRFMRWYRI